MNRIGRWNRSRNSTAIDAPTSCPRDEFSTAISSVEGVGMETSVPPVVLTGMHRSGTSMMARFLNRLGVHMGDDLLEAGAGNKYGHFEDVAFLRFHEELLTEVGGESMWAERPPPVDDAVRRRADSLAKEASRDVPWGWKDPRTTLFLDLWLDVFPDALFLFMVRDPMSVVDSLCRRMDKLFPGRNASWWRRNVGEHRWFLKMYNVFNAEIITFLKRQPDARFLVVPLEELIVRPEPILDRIGAFIEVSIIRSDFEDLLDRNAIKVDPPLSTTPAAWRLLREARRLYSELQTWSTVSPAPNRR